MHLTFSDLAEAKKPQGTSYTNRPKHYVQPHAALRHQ